MGKKPPEGKLEMYTPGAMSFKQATRIYQPNQAAKIPSPRLGLTRREPPHLVYTTWWETRGSG